MRIAPIVFAAALVAGACDAPVATQGSCPPSGVITPGEKLPSCSFERLFDAGTLSLASLHGKPSVINFWASWCTYCIREMPDFDEVYRALGGAVHMVGMDVLGPQAERRQDAERFARRTGVTYPLAYDQGGQFFAHFGGSTVRPQLPLTVFSDATGTVKYRHFGPYRRETLAAAIREHLGIG